MKCPNCDTEFKKNMVANRYGRLMEVNRCSSCGGFWFRRFELYNMTSTQACELDHAIEKAAARAKKFCPECHEELFAFQDLNIPPDLHFERCAQCAGVWVPTGELAVYKKSQIHDAPVYGFSKPVKSSLAVVATGLFGFALWLDYLVYQGKFSFSADANQDILAVPAWKILAFSAMATLCYLGVLVFLLTRRRRMGFAIFSLGLFLALVYVFWAYGPLIY